MQSNFSLKVFTLLEILKERSENSLFSFAKVEHASLFLLRAYKDIPSFSNCADAFEKYVDAVLDCCLLPEGCFSVLKEKEILFFGPDENTADLMDVGALLARARGYKYWKAMTTGKSVRLGG